MLLYLIQCLKSQGIFGVRYSAKPKANQLSPKVGYLRTTVILGVAESLSTLRCDILPNAKQTSCLLKSRTVVIFWPVDLSLRWMRWLNGSTTRTLHSTCGPAGYVCQFCHIPVRLERQSLVPLPLWVSRQSACPAD